MRGARRPGLAALESVDSPLPPLHHRATPPLDRLAEAAEAYDAALALVSNAAERRFLEQRRHELKRASGSA